LFHVELKKIIKKLLGTATAKAKRAGMNEPLPTDRLSVPPGNGVRVAERCQVLSAVPSL